VTETAQFSERRTARVLLRVAIIVAVVAALVFVETQSRSGVLWRFVTFTYQANLLAAAYYGWTLLNPEADRRAGLRGAVVLYVVVAGVVWNLFLVDMSAGHTPANLLLHVVVPVLAFVDWVLVGQSQAQVRWWQPLAWLAYPAVYLGLAVVVLNNLGRRAPYYFLDAGSIGGAAVAVNVCILAAGFVGLGYALTLVGRAAAKIGV
jgi:hypothetical protein